MDTHSTDDASSNNATVASREQRSTHNTNSRSAPGISGRRDLGIGLALITAALWGVLPIVMKGMLGALDATTIVWSRFIFAAVMLFPIVAFKGNFWSSMWKPSAGAGLAFIAIAGLCGNYALYLLGLEFISPSATQIIIQIAPMFLLLGGMLFFHERYGRMQWIGLGVLICGMALFFNHRYAHFSDQNSPLIAGALLIAASGASWTAYALAQKRLLRSYSSESLMLLLFIAGTIVFTPFAQPAALFELMWASAALVGVIGAITVASYLSFAESMRHVEASRVSVVLSATPLFTVLAMQAVGDWNAELLQPERLNLLSVVGALIVVAGSALSAFGRGEK